MLALLCSWHFHIEPALYAHMGTRDEELGAGNCDSAKGESEILDYDGTGNLPGREITIDEPEDVGANECWHSSLAMKVR